MRKLVLIISFLLSGLAFANPPGTFQPLLLAATGGGPIGTPTSLGTVANTTTGQTTAILTLTAPISSADLIVVCIVTDRNPMSSGLVTSVVDSGGVNSYSLAGTARGTTAAGDAEIWYSANASALSSGSITITVGGTIQSGRSITAAAANVSGIKTSPLDISANSATSSLTPTVSTGTLSQANEIIFGCDGMIGSATYTPSSSSAFTQIGSTLVSNDTLGFVYRLAPTTASVTNAPVWSSSSGIQAPQAIASFRGN